MSGLICNPVRCLTCKQEMEAEGQEFGCMWWHCEPCETRHFKNISAPYRISAGDLDLYQYRNLVENDGNLAAVLKYPGWEKDVEHAQTPSD